jgi:pyridoxamine 5'-phosphate oxidase
MEETALDVTVEPFALWRAWFAAAGASEPVDPNAMALATVDADGRPSCRTVLLKDADARGFVFYTNTLSRKGRALAAHPRAALLFHWKSLARQVRAEGAVEPVTEAEADAYFATRARTSRLGAHASLQSEPLPERALLERRVAEAAARFPGPDVPRPPHWSGYRLVPDRLEFWQDMPYRLHDRVQFDRAGDTWRATRLFP